MAPGAKLCGVVNVPLRPPIRSAYVAHAEMPVARVAAAATATAETTATAAARYRRVAIAHTASSPGCTLINAPPAAAAPTAGGRSIQRHAAANPRKRIGSTWPSLTA